MDISIKNLGAISEANFTVGDLTVICGKNNTGKTYLTYAVYGFLDFWKRYKGNSKNPSLPPDMRNYELDPQRSP